MRALGELRTGTGALPAAARRAVRTTLAACTGFYLFLYGLGQPVSATYALFGAVSLAGLSRIPGTGRQRAAVMVRLLPVACVLVILGTFLAVRTWSAVLGMAVIGFCVAFSAAAGPRPAGAAAGLQLLYILPSFPPYAPHTLDERLGGTLTGLLLLIMAEAWVLPDPRVATYAERAAGSTAEAARCAAALERPPYVLTESASDRARAAAEALRSSRVPEAERPAGPGLRERALAHTGLAARTLLSRLRNLPAPPAGREPRQAGIDLLGAVRASATGSSTLLREGRRPVADSTELLRLRARNARTPAELPESRRRQAALLEVADAAVALRTAAEIAVEGAARTWRGTRRTGSGTSGRTPCSCGGTGSPHTPGRGPCTSRTPYGSRWPSRWPVPWPDSTPSRTASGRCSRSSASPGPPPCRPGAPCAPR